jgi:hypothetical protein
MNNYPACFNSQAEYDLWKDARHISATRCQPCTDCTVDYKVEMCLQDRCAHPEVRFRLDEDGFTEGYFPPIANGYEIADKAMRMILGGPIKISHFNRKFKITPVDFPVAGDVVGVYAIGVTVGQIEQDMLEVL